MTFVKKQTDIFKKAFNEIDLRILLTTLYDLLFWTLSALTIFGLLAYLNAETKKLPFLAQGYQGLLTATEEQAGAYLGLARWFLIKFIIIITLCVLIPYVLYTLSRILIWSTMAGKKFHASLYARFLGLSLLWHCISSLPMLIAIFPLYALAQAANATGGALNAGWGLLTLFWTITIILYYFTHNIYYHFSATHRVFDSLKLGFIDGFRGIPVRALPCLLGLALILLWISLTGWLALLMGAVPGTTSASAILIFTMLVTLLLIAFGRHYLYIAIRETQHEKQHIGQHIQHQKQNHRQQHNH